MDLNKLLDWLENNLPGLLLAFGVGFKDGQRCNEALKKKLLEEETKRKLLEEELAATKAFDGVSDSDIVNKIAGRNDK